MKTDEDDDEEDDEDDYEDDQDDKEEYIHYGQKEMKFGKEDDIR